MCAHAHGPARHAPSQSKCTRKFHSLARSCPPQSRRKAKIGVMANLKELNSLPVRHGSWRKEQLNRQQKRTLSMSKYVELVKNLRLKVRRTIASGRWYQTVGRERERSNQATMERQQSAHHAVRVFNMHADCVRTLLWVIFVASTVYRYMHLYMHIL